MMCVKTKGAVTADKNQIYLSIKKSQLNMTSLKMRIRHKTDTNSGWPRLMIVDKRYIEGCVRSDLETTLYIQDVRLMLYIYDCIN